MAHAFDRHREHMADNANRQNWIRLVITVAFMAAVWFVLICHRTGYDFALAYGMFRVLLLYHIGIRIVVGTITGKTPLDAFHPDAPLWRQRPWEDALYKKLQVKQWKKKMPMFDVDKWDIRSCSADELLRAGCQAEACHMGNIALSLASVVLVPLTGSLVSALVGAVVLPDAFVLMFAAVTASGFDAIFVIIQRFNRPRFMRLANYLSPEEAPCPEA